MIPVVALLILLHGVDGREIRINPSQVTSLRAATTEPNKVMHPDAKCVINLSDGKYVQVIETCEAIQSVLESLDQER